MARVRVCTVCGRHNSATEIFCEGCGVPIEHIAAQDDASLEAAPAAERVDGAGGPITSGADNSPNSPPSPAAGSGQRTESRLATATVREARRRKGELLFPWGVEGVEPRLAIGRDGGFCPFADRLQQYPRVSGIHAEFSFDGERLTVRHLGRTNPTRVNGRPLETGESVELSDGDSVGFSTDLTARVRIL